MKLSLDGMMKAAAVLAVVGLCRSAYIHFVVEPPADLFREAPALDSGFQPLRKLLPAAGEVGYVTDLPLLLHPGREWQVPKHRFLLAQYAPAPPIPAHCDDPAPPGAGRALQAGPVDWPLPRPASGG